MSSTTGRRFAAGTRDGIEFFNVLGVGVSAINVDRAVAKILSWIHADRKCYVTVTGMHGLIEAHSHADLKDIFNKADMVTPDGMPLVYIGRQRRFAVEQVRGADLMREVMRQTNGTDVSHFFYGGAPGVAELLEKRLREQFPDLHVVGSYCPPFRPLSDLEEDEIVERINGSDANIVWVGISTPKQDRWMKRMRQRLQPQVLIGVGAAFDFHAGLKTEAPKWMRVAALEWLYRLMCEPGRLWRRYAYGVPKFIWLVTRESLGPTAS